MLFLVQTGGMEEGVPSYIGGNDVILPQGIFLAVLRLGHPESGALFLEQRLPVGVGFRFNENLIIEIQWLQSGTRRDSKKQGPTRR